MKSFEHVALACMCNVFEANINILDYSTEKCTSVCDIPYSGKF